MSSHPGNEACGLVKEARDVLLGIIVDVHGHVGEVPLVEARHDGGCVQNMSDAALFQGFQISGRPYGACSRRSTCVSPALIAFQLAL